MSQAGELNTAAGPVPPTVATSYVTDSGTAVPAANVLNVPGGSSSVNVSNGIQTTGSGNNLTVRLTNRFSASTTTVGATTSDAITFPLGVVPGTFFFSFQVAVFNPSTPAGAGYASFTTVRTDGATATIIGDTDTITHEDAALVTTTAQVVVSANNVIFQVGGVAGLTIDWVVVGTYLEAN